MKKAFLFALPMFWGAFVFGQNPLQDFQEFSFKNIQFTEHKNTFNAGLSVRFDVEGRYLHSELKKNGNSLFPPDYNLYLWLADKQGDTLAIADANPSFFLHLSGMKGNEYGLRAHFPYYAFAKTGKQEFTLMGRAVHKLNGTALPPFAGSRYTAQVLQQIPIEKQEVQVGEIRILPDSEVKSAKGILFRFPASYSYSENELFSTTEKSGTISYRLVLTHPTGYDVYFPLDNMPRKQAEITDNPVKNATASLSIFVPYTLLSLSEGMHEMQYRLDAQTLGGSVAWPRLREGSFRFSMPRLYLTQTRVDSISVAQGSYDVAAKDIPLVNLFVGRKSKAGKGLPDLFWVLKSNGLEVLRTSVAQNSLYAPDKLGNFQMMEDEILALTVYDHDLISRNDVMGSFEFPKLQGETRWTKSGLTSQYVKSGRIEVMRKVRPDCPDLQFSIESLKQEGITGYLVQLSPPELRNAEVKNIHILSAEGLVHKTVPLSVFQANAQNRLHYFMPAWEWPANAQTTVTITDTEWNIPICGFTAFPEKNITQTDDITLHWKKPQEVVQNGVYGLQIEVWTEYGFDLKYLNDMRFECQMSDKNKTYFSTSGALNQWVNTSNPQQPNTFFIPYRAFENKENTTTRLKVNLKTTHSQSGFITGTLTDSAEVQLEALQEVPELEFTALAKFKKGMKSLKMITAQGSMGEEKIREIPADVNIHQTLRFPVERIHAKDELSVRFVAEYTNGKTLQGGVSFTLKYLEKTGEKSMAKAGLLKKVVIRRK